MRIKKSKGNKDEPKYKQYLTLQNEPNDHIAHHITSQDIDYWENRSILKHRVLKNARRLKREFVE